MSKEGLAQHEFTLIQEIAREPNQTQRQLSHNAGLSLGMTNMLLVRLAKKGLIKIRQLDWKHTEYLLTLEGALEKSKKSFAYIQHTFNLFTSIMEKVRTTAQAEYDKGLRHFVIIAWPMTESPLSQAFAEMNLDGVTIEFVETFTQLGTRKGTIFVATEETVPKPAPGQKFVQILDVSDIKFKFPE
jgi:predicted transcriptional regulator